MSAITLLALVSLLQANAELGQTVVLKSPSEGYRLAVQPPAGDFRIELVVKCDKPGIVLDSVGINAAPTGSYSLNIGPDRKVNFQVWQPGWTVITSTKPISTNEERIIVQRTGERVGLTVAGETKVGTIKAPLSRDPLWIGDFPGDDSWGKNYNIHPAMVGSVRVVVVAPMRPTTEVVVDDTGTVSSALRLRMTKALQTISMQTGGKLYVFFPVADNLDDTLAAAVRLREAQQAASPDVPVGVLSYSAAGRGYSRTTTFDAKLNFEQAKSAWAATTGDNLADRVAQQLEVLAGQKPTTGPAKIIGEAKVGPEGGRVAATTGDVEVTFPAGALMGTETVKISEVNSGNNGRIVQVEAGGRLLARPATLSYRIPPTMDASTVVAVGQVTSDLWTIHPSEFNPATRTLTAKTNHFSNQGWFGMDRQRHKIVGSITYGLTGATLLHISSIALVGTGAAITAPAVAVLAVFGLVGWFAGGAEYDMLMKRGFAGPIPVEGFSVYWKPEQVKAKGQATVLVHKKTNRILAWIKDTDQWAPVGEANTLTIELPAGEKFNLEDIASVKVPTAVLNLTTELSATRQWFDRNGLKPPPKTAVLVTSDVDKLPTGEKNAGEYDGAFLKINGELLTDEKASSNVVRATMAHEYFHAVAKHNGYKEQFLGGEEAVCVAVESLVWPGANDGLTMNGWNVAGTVLQNGLKGTGQGEGFDPVDRRGYVLWSFPKYLYHQHGAEDLRSLAAGAVPADLLAQQFRAYVRSFTNREDSLDKEVDSDDGRGKVATGWPVPITELAQSANMNNLKPGKVDVPPTPALGVRTMTVRVPSGTPTGPLVVRRRVPLLDEEISVLKPKGAAVLAVSSDDRTRGEVITEYSVVATPKDWDTGEVMLPILLSSAKGAESGTNPLYVYRLVPPPTFESVSASDGYHLKWALPTLNGVPPGDALWGYGIYGRLPGGEVRLVQELRFRPDQTPGALSGKGGSRNAVTIPVTTTEYVLPTIAGNMFEAFGIASLELAAKNESAPVVSEIQWAGAPADDLLKELQKSTQIVVRLAGVTEIQADDNPNMKSGYSSYLTITNGDGMTNTVRAIMDLAKSYEKPVAAPQLTWSGTEFTLTLDVGPLIKTSTSRTGTSVSAATRNLSIQGRYDPKSRKISSVTATYKLHDTGDFTPDPNWKPRSTVESLYPPKASKSLNRMSQTISLADVPFTRSVKDQSGNTWFQFILKADKLVPNCNGIYEMEFTATDQPSQKKLHRYLAGPPTLGVAVYPPEVVVVFIVPRS